MCHKPLKGWRSRTINPETGKRAIVFNRSQGLVDLPVELPCGQCKACRLERSRQWAMRCVHEAAEHSDNIFVTLTYDNEHLPQSRSLYYRDYQLFMKRLRKWSGANKLRFYMCGEYGETYGRPHYHACLFGFDLPDKVLWKEERGVRLYTSEILQSIWGNGFTTVGEVNFQSAAYVARYVMKKVTGEPAQEHYEYIDPETGEVFDRTPEFTKMSLKPGIGATWFERFKSDVFPDDFVVMNGKKVAPPRFYTKLYEITYPDVVQTLKVRRKQRAKSRSHDNTPARLRVKAKVLDAKLSLLKRTIE